MIFLVVVMKFSCGTGLDWWGRSGAIYVAGGPAGDYCWSLDAARRLRYWQASIAVVAFAFVAAWFWNPPYGFSPEDNLAYRDYIVLHQDGRALSGSTVSHGARAHGVAGIGRIGASVAGLHYAADAGGTH